LVACNKAQLFVRWWRQDQLVLKTLRQNDPANIPTQAGIHNQAEGLAPVTARSINHLLNRLTGLRINRDLLNSKRRTDFDLHRAAEEPSTIPDMVN